MRILLAHRYYREYGGEDVAVDRQMALLESHGHAVTCVTPRSNISVVAAFRPDVVHLHNTFPMIAPPVIAAARSLGVPIAMTVHNYRLRCANGLFFRGGTNCEECPEAGNAWPAVRHRCYRGSRVASAAAAGILTLQQVQNLWGQIDYFIAPSHFVADKLSAMGIARSRLRVIPHGVPSLMGDEQPRSGILYAGRLSEEKGVRVLLHAFARLDASHHLTLAGDGPLAELVAQAARVDARIRWLGRISPWQVQEQMRRAVAVAVPSLCYETFGLAVAEAFAASTPVIGVSQGAIGEMIRNGVTGLHTLSGNAASLAEGIRYALSHEKQMRAMGHNARAHYERHFTPQAQYGALSGLYEEATGYAAYQAA
ncbi:MAG: glycosyltransferase family 4 protein [Alphaproteobacteria bacterium]|nr:glycosyltransferase family 4 protein [Alphaproteobacteria bacterium]